MADQTKTKEEKPRAVCGKCKKPMEMAETDFDVYHAACLSLDEIIALASHPKKK